MGETVEKARYPEIRSSVTKPNMFILLFGSENDQRKANVRRPKGLDVPQHHILSAGYDSRGEQEIDDPWHARPAAQQVTRFAWTLRVASPDRLCRSR